MGEQWTEPSEATRFRGEESFNGLRATVRDFWAYALRDLRSNTTRGLLAEWLVSQAVGATTHQVDWHEFDVLTPDKVRIEVKSSAYLQAWTQKNLSRIVFSRLKARRWDPATGESSDATYNADVYVFCVQTATSHAEYDPLDVDQWEFYVASRRAIETLGYASVGLSTLRRVADGPLPFGELAGAMRAGAEPDETATARGYDV